MIKIPPDHVARANAHGSASYNAWTRARPANDFAAMELGKHADHLKHRAARRRGGVEALLMQEEIDLFGMKLPQEIQEVGQSAAETIDGPAATMSISRRATALSNASSAGRCLRPFAPEMTASSKTCTTVQPWRLATAYSSRR